jgi:hypothetical protein
MAVVAGQSQLFYSGVGIFNWYYLSSPPQIPRFFRFDLESGGLIYRIQFSTNRFGVFRNGPQSDIILMLIRGYVKHLIWLYDVLIYININMYKTPGGRMGL